MVELPQQRYLQNLYTTSVICFIKPLLWQFEGKQIFFNPGADLKTMWQVQNLDQD